MTPQQTKRLRSEMASDLRWICIYLVTTPVLVVAFVWLAAIYSGAAFLVMSVAVGSSIKVTGPLNRYAKRAREIAEEG